MKTSLPTLLVIVGLTLGLASVQAKDYKLSIRAFQTEVVKVETDKSQASEGHPVIWSISDIKLPLGKTKKVALKSDHRGSLAKFYDKKKIERCELLLTPEADGTFKLHCDWIISDKGKGSASEERRTYTKTLTLYQDKTYAPEQWSFTPQKGEDRFLAFHLTK